MTNAVRTALVTIFLFTVAIGVKAGEAGVKLPQDHELFSGSDQIFSP